MKKGRLAVPEKLRSAAKLFEERAASYGDNYWKCAHIMQTLFPEGLELKTEEQFVRKQFLEHIVNKVTRYAANFNLGGHDDSSYDLAVYAMMLNAADDIFRAPLPLKSKATKAGKKR